MNPQAEVAITLARDMLDVRRDVENAVKMAAYMKTEMPFYGVSSPERGDVYKHIKSQITITDNKTYRAVVAELWKQPHREEKYLAIDVAEGFKKFITPSNMDLYEKLIREGSWWDFVDRIAPNLVGPVLLNHREDYRSLMDVWNEDDDMWIRRTSIISQLKHKKETDVDMLFLFCIARFHETEFFIRKAIGWSLRQHSYADPDAVIAFLEEHKDAMSGLSYREGKKRLVRVGLMD